MDLINPPSSINPNSATEPTKHRYRNHNQLLSSPYSYSHQAISVFVPLPTLVTHICCVTMPTSTKPVNISPYEIANELPLPKNKPLLINQKRRSAVSLRELPPSPANSDLDASTMPPTSALSKDESRLFRPLERGAPGDQAIFSDSKTPEQKDLAKRKSQFYTEAFAQREPNSSARERISRESMVVADVRTNVIVSSLPIAKNSRD